MKSINKKELGEVDIGFQYWTSPVHFPQTLNQVSTRRRTTMPDNAARNFSQKASADTIDALEKSKASAQETTKIMEQSYVRASKGAVDFNLKLIDMAQENLNAAFDFARQVPTVKSPSEFLELSVSHARTQFESLTKQTQHLTGLAQNAIKETAESWQSAAKSSTSSRR